MKRLLSGLLRWWGCILFVVCAGILVTLGLYGNLLGMEMKPEFSIYEQLGLNRKSTLPEIKSAWRKWAARNHPDKVSDDITKEEAEKRWIEFNDEYQKLQDPKTRFIHDIAIETNPVIRIIMVPLSRNENRATSVQSIPIAFVILVVASASIIVALILRLLVIFLHKIVYYLYSLRNYIFICATLFFVSRNLSCIYQGSDYPILSLLSPSSIVLAIALACAVAKIVKSVK